MTLCKVDQQTYPIFHTAILQSSIDRVTRPWHHGVQNNFFLVLRSRVSPSGGTMRPSRPTSKVWSWSWSSCVCVCERERHDGVVRPILMIHAGADWLRACATLSFSVYSMDVHSYICTYTVYIDLHHRDGWKQWLDTSSQMSSKSRE